MKLEKLLMWFKHEVIALGKDFFWGAVALIFLLLIIMGFATVANVLFWMAAFVTNNLLLQVILAFGILSFIGIISRKLQKSKRFSPFKKFLPAEIFKKPEVAYYSDGNKLTLGILIKVHSVKIDGRIYEMGEIVPAQGAPTSGGHLSGKLVSVDELYVTGRTYGQALAACMSFGMKMSPIGNLVPFTSKEKMSFEDIINFENSVEVF